MNINILKDSKTDSKQPKVYDLGQITTTLQNLLDESNITITDEQIIILKITDINDNIKYYFLPLKDYKGSTVYGLGKDILETDLININGNTEIPYREMIYLNFEDILLDSGQYDIPESAKDKIILVASNTDDEGIITFNLPNVTGDNLPEFHIMFAQSLVNPVTTTTEKFIEYVDLNAEIIGNTLHKITDRSKAIIKLIGQDSNYVLNYLNSSSKSTELLPNIQNNYTDDTDASLNNINIGQMYHTAGVVKIRLT